MSRLSEAFGFAATMVTTVAGGAGVIGSIMGAFALAAALPVAAPVAVAVAATAGIAGIAASGGIIWLGLQKAGQAMDG